MRFNTLYVSKWGDGDPEDARVIETPTYTLHSLIAGDSCDRFDVIGKYCRVNGIHSVVLCPGFTNTMVARVAAEVGENVAVAVSRTDGPGSGLTAGLKEKAREGLKT